MLGAIIGAGSSLVGGLLNKKSAKSQAAQDRQFQREMLREQMLIHRADKRDDRKYAERITREDRSYAERELAKDRAYAAEVLADERDYVAGLADKNLRLHNQDREFLQKRSNNLARMSAESRGIDFTRLRDDAVAAGYNPMTALSMAHAYSTDVNYQLQASGNAPLAGFQAGGGVAPMSAPAPARVAAGGSFQAGGSGYSNSFNPALSSGGFIQEAIDRAADTYFNRPAEPDKLATALNNAFEIGEKMREADRYRSPGSFGYDLTEQVPYSPSMRTGVPAIRDRDLGMSPSDPLVPVSREALNAGIGKLKPISGISDAEAYEARYGEIGGELAGLPALVLDATDAAGKAVRQKIFDWKYGAGFRPPRSSRKARDYMESGRTGTTMLRSRGGGGPANPYTNEVRPVFL